MRRTQHLSARQDTGLVQSIHGYMFDLRCMSIRLDVDVTCALLQVQSNETLMDICDELRFEDIDVVMRGGTNPEPDRSLSQRRILFFLRWEAKTSSRRD